MENPLKPVSFASIGECMIELSAGKGDLWRMGFAGDTFNTAWYARQILPKERARRLRDGARRRSVLRAACAISSPTAGVETDRIRTIPGRRPGLYAITLKNAERAFTYWRGRVRGAAPRRRRRVAEAARSPAREMLYFSGITLAILTPAARRRLLRELAARRKAGARIAFDPNFRAGALAGQKTRARGDGGRVPRRRHRAADLLGRDGASSATSTVDDTARRMAEAGVGEYRRQERRQAGSDLRRRRRKAACRR